MSFVAKLGIALAPFWCSAALAQDGYFGHQHDRWHQSFYQTLFWEFEPSLGTNKIKELR